MKSDRDYVIYSVRGTEKYFQRFPFNRRRSSPNHVSLKVADLPSSAGSLSGLSHFAPLSVECDGVQYVWDLVFLREYTQPRNGAPEGEFVMPIFANHGHSNAVDRDGGRLSTFFDLTPVREKTTSLQSIVPHFRNDVSLADSVITNWPSSQRVAMPVKDDTMQYTDLKEMTDAAYAAALRKARWQQCSGNWTGEDPPDGFYESLTTFAPDPLEKFGDEFYPLPKTITGTITDFDG